MAISLAMAKRAMEGLQPVFCQGYERELTIIEVHESFMGHYDRPWAIVAKPDGSERGFFLSELEPGTDLENICRKEGIK